MGSGIDMILALPGQPMAQSTCTGVPGVFTNGFPAPNFEDGHFRVVVGPAEAVVRVLIHRALSLE